MKSHWGAADDGCLSLAAVHADFLWSPVQREHTCLHLQGMEAHNLPLFQVKQTIISSSFPSHSPREEAVQVSNSLPTGWPYCKWPGPLCQTQLFPVRATVD